MTLPPSVLRCPSCGTQVPPQNPVRGKIYCLQCLAHFDVETKRWKFEGRTLVPTVKPPNRDHYIECKECSELEGETVLYHFASLRKETGFFNQEETTYCPRGHEMKAPVKA